MIIVQVNDKVRDRLSVPVGVSQGEVQSLALASERVERFVDGKPIVHVVYVSDKLLSIVTR
jgi:leucyl-tRNA synthetase